MPSIFKSAIHRMGRVQQATAHGGPTWLQTHHCITVYSLPPPSPPPPLILASSSRLVPNARFKRRATREL